MTLFEAYNPPSLPTTSDSTTHAELLQSVKSIDPFANLKGKKIAWVGDTNNIINEIMVTMPRLGMEVSVASPKGYNEVDPRVWKRMYVFPFLHTIVLTGSTEAGTEKMIHRTTSPEEALQGADVVVTDTWYVLFSHNSA